MTLQQQHLTQGLSDELLVTPTNPIIYNYNNKKQCNNNYYNNFKKNWIYTASIHEAASWIKLWVIQNMCEILNL